jgi:hypothetical protein
VWEHAWSSARVLLRLSEREFWRLTPRQLRLMLDRLEDQNARLEFACGQIAAAAVNSLGAAKEPVHSSDFFGSKWAREYRKRKDDEAQDQQRIADAFRALMRTLPQLSDGPSPHH